MKDVLQKEQKADSPDEPLDELSEAPRPKGGAS